MYWAKHSHWWSDREFGNLWLPNSFAFLQPTSSIPFKHRSGWNLSRRCMLVCCYPFFSKVFYVLQCQSLDTFSCMLEITACLRRYLDQLLTRRVDLLTNILASSMPKYVTCRFLSIFQCHQSVDLSKFSLMRNILFPAFPHEFLLPMWLHVTLILISVYLYRESTWLRAQRDWRSIGCSSCLKSCFHTPKCKH